MTALRATIERGDPLLVTNVFMIDDMWALGAPGPGLVSWSVTRLSVVPLRGHRP